ncbi:MAG TPA: glycosyltransferase [Nitrospira sp.]|nr:glycosyltransferase [Nitrospira sp.]
MTTLSLSMIVKNEEALIERVLACAKTFCDEMIVVDTGSTDRTVELAEKMGAKVYHFEWIEDFAAARNYSLAQCTGDWVMWLDADDIITPECQQKFKEIKETVLNDSLNGVVVPYYYLFDAEDNCTCINRRERMFRRAAGFQWEHPIHEVIYLTGETITREDVWIEHRFLPGKDSPKRNIRVLAKAMQKEEHYNNQRMVYIAAKELRLQNMFDKSIEYFERFLELNPSRRGWQAYDVYMCMGLCYKRMDNRLDDARRCFTSAMHADSRRAEAYDELAFLHYEAGEWQYAIPYFETALRCVPPLGEDLIALEHYGWLPNEYLSRCYANVGNYYKAIEVGMKGLPEHPNKANMLATITWYVSELSRQLGIE